MSGERENGSAEGEPSFPAGEAPFRAIADNASAAIAVKDLEGRFLYVNRRFEALTRRPRAALVGAREVDVFPPELVAQLRDADRAVLDSGTPSEREERLVGEEGERTGIVARFPLRTRAGEIYAICAVATDITDRKRAEAALEENREKYRGLSEAAFESIFISEKGICLEQNRTAELTFGYSSEEALGRSGIEWIAPEDRALVMKNMLAGFEEPYQVTARRKDGSTFPAMIRGKMTRYRGRSVRVTSLSDITALERAQAELRQAQKMDLIGTLAGGIAHDFNNVLAAMMAEATFALSELPDGPSSVRDSLAAIVRAADRGGALTQRLLTFARPGRERPRSAVDLALLLQNLLPMLRRLLPSRIELDASLEPACGALVDASQIEQVVVNLVVNARDAIEGAGRIAVRLKPIELSSDAEGLGLSPGPHVRVSVEDSGAGIAAKDLERIFDPFFTTKPLGQGTGLGLSVVRGIAEAHRGAVRALSVVGASTRLELYLPRVEPGDRPASMLPEPDPQARPGETVLVADDEPAIRRGITQILEKAGYRVLCAEDGLRTIELHRERAAEVDLVVLDAMMPGMTGLEVYELLSARSAASVRVLFCSGYAIEDKDPALRLPPGCRFLAKPFRAHALLAAVRAMLDE